MVKAVVSSATNSKWEILARLLKWVDMRTKAWLVVRVVVFAARFRDLSTVIPPGKYDHESVEGLNMLTTILHNW